MAKTNLWEKLGFKENPFDTKPLNVNQNDVDLLIGRESEQVEFLTTLESSEQGVFVISGVPGVGKTSFLNIQQYLIENDLGYSDKMLAARNLCPIQPYDEPIHIALRALQSYVTSIVVYCEENKKKKPKQVEQVHNWLFQNKPTTFEFGFSILGNGINYGREVHLPSMKDATFETIGEIIKTVSLEVKTELKFCSSFIVLDNLENLETENLNDVLVSFRDTLFTIDGIWWVLIGQSGLTSLIQSIAPKVFQRLSGGIELKPISIEDIIKAVNKRVEKFHTNSTVGKSPVSENIYTKLFKCSNGEIRFVFKYCTQICISFVQMIRKLMVLENAKIDDDTFNNFIGRYIVEKTIKDDFALDCLKDKIREEFEGLYLSNNHKCILKQIGKIDKIKPSDFKLFSECGIKTLQEFTNSHLITLHNQNLLLRRQEGKVITYELRGIASLALEFEIIE